MSDLRWAALLVAAFLLSGCGVLTKEDLKPAPKTLSHGRFVYLADRACARDIRRARALKHPTSAAMVSRELHFAIRSGEHLIFVLRGLAPPPSEAADFRRLLAAENGEDLVATHLAEAFDGGQVQRVRTLVRKLRILGRRVHSRSAKLGLHACAKD
jgi:hypothetical protein